MQIYFKNSFISIYYDKAARLGKAEWRGHLHGPELREAYLLCQDLIDRHSLVRWLADDRLMQSIAPADLAWSLREHVPRMATGPLLRMARLPSHHKQNREAVDMMIDKGSSLETHLEIRDFTEEQEALDWLLNPL